MWATAPANFTRSDEGGYSYVFKQPTTPEEEALCKEAMEGCPVEQAYRNFQRHVNRLCFLIVASECSDREIDIERRVQVATLFPEKMPLYDVVYESRFRRLRQHFRERP